MSVFRAASRYRSSAFSEISGIAPKRASHGMRRVMEAHKASMVSMRSLRRILQQVPTQLPLVIENIAGDFECQPFVFRLRLHALPGRSQSFNYARSHLARGLCE